MSPALESLDRDRVAAVATTLLLYRSPQDELERDFEQLRIEFLSRCRGKDGDAGVEEWIEKHDARIGQFRELIARARGEGHVSAPMLAQIAGQARILLGR